MGDSVGVIGYGFVGKAVAQLEAVATAHIYDVADERYNSDLHKRKAYGADIIFINVPTDLRDGRLDISIIESCMSDFLANKGQNVPALVIKSTISPGVCRKLTSKYGVNNIVFNPEFLSQRTALADFVNQQEVYLAGKGEYTRKVEKLYHKFFDYCGNDKAEIFKTISWEEVELLKLARNSFYGVKVSFCNYIANLCETNGIDYAKFAESFGRGEWVGAQHTRVPGSDGQYGYGGKCLPKDSIEMLNYAAESGIVFGVLQESIEFNKKQRRLKC